MYRNWASHNCRPIYNYFYDSSFDVASTINWTAWGVIIALAIGLVQIGFWFYDRNKENKIDKKVKELLIAELHHNKEVAEDYLKKLNDLRDKKEDIKVIGDFYDIVFDSIINSHRAVKFLSPELIAELIECYSDTKATNKVVTQTLSKHILKSAIRGTLKDSFVKEPDEIKNTGIKNIGFNKLITYEENENWVKNSITNCTKLMDKLRKL